MLGSHSPTMHLVNALMPRRLPECHSRMTRKKKGTQRFKNSVKVTAEQQHKLSHYAHRLSSQHQSGSLKKLGIQLIWPAGWCDFEIILLLSWPPASNGKGRAEQFPPKMTLETEDWTCECKPLMHFPYIKRSVKMSRTHDNQIVNEAG